MIIKFEMSKPFVDVDVLGARLLEMDEEVGFDKVIKSVSEGKSANEGFVIE